MVDHAIRYSFPPGVPLNRMEFVIAVAGNTDYHTGRNLRDDDKTGFVLDGWSGTDE